MQMARGDALYFAEITEDMKIVQPEGWRTRVSLRGWRKIVADVAMRVLNRIGALEQFYYSTKVYRYGETERKAVTEMVFAQIDAAMSRTHRYWDPDEWVIVIGGKEFAEIVEGAAGCSIESVPTAEIARGGAYRQRFAGLPVHIVPYLSGAAVLPKAIVEVKRVA